MLKWTFFLHQNLILYALGFSAFVFITSNFQLSFLLVSLFYCFLFAHTFLSLSHFAELMLNEAVCC